MDFIQIIFGRYLLELIGALIRFIYLNICRLIKSDNFISLSQIFSPKGNLDKKNGNSELNHMIGVIFFGIFIILLIIFMV
jgi:hypothetical protein